MPIRDQAAPLPIHLATDVPGKPVEDVLSAWGPEPMWNT